MKIKCLILSLSLLMTSQASHAKFLPGGESPIMKCFMALHDVADKDATFDEALNSVPRTELNFEVCPELALDAKTDEEFAASSKANQDCREALLGKDMKKALLQIDRSDLMDKGQICEVLKAL